MCLRCDAEGVKVVEATMFPSLGGVGGEGIGVEPRSEVVLHLLYIDSCQFGRPGCFFLTVVICSPLVFI